MRVRRQLSGICGPLHNVGSGDLALASGLKASALKPSHHLRSQESTDFAWLMVRKSSGDQLSGRMKDPRRIEPVFY